MTNMLNPTWLKTFVTLIDVGHFTKAAEKLFMTQPGVSQHISKLEKACGHSLIKRNKKSFEITEQGRLVYDYSKKQDLYEQDLLNKLAFDDPQAGDCSIACSGSVALSLYPKLLSLQSQFPQLIIKLKAAPNYQILTEILNGSIDQGLVTDVPDKKLFDAQEFAQKELCLVIPKGTYEIANAAQQLMNLGLISHPDAEHYLSIYLNRCHDPALRQLDINNIRVVGFVNQISQILLPVSRGIGFTILPQGAIENFNDKHKLKIIEPNQKVIETLYIAKKKGRILPERYKKLNEFIKAPGTF